MPSSAQALSEISTRLLAVLERERSEGAAPSGLTGEKEALALELESWLGTFDPAKADEAGLKLLAETIMTLQTHTAVSAQLARVRLDLATLATPGRPLEGRSAATYTQTGGRQTPADPGRVNKTF